MSDVLTAPFPWFGGKSRVAGLVWERFGDVVNYVEPFFGSGAVLLGRPGGAREVETVNDLDGLVANFWRATQHDPDTVAYWADNPVNENDLSARHSWLVSNMGHLQEMVSMDPDYYDAKIAGWWVWGLCAWIGSGWCSGYGPWVSGTTGFVKKDEGRGINRKLPHLGNGQGINRKLPHLGDAGRGINRQLPHLGSAGQGINRQLPHLGNGRGINRKLPHLGISDLFQQLRDRLRRVRVCCGDWSRVCGPSVTFKHGLTGVFLDPPYAGTAGRTDNLYRVDSNDVAHAVREWAIANGDNPKMRIAVCGYENEHVFPSDWTCVEWRAIGGYGSQGNGVGRENANRERIWFSPHCLGSSRSVGIQGSLFSD